MISEIAWLMDNSIVTHQRSRRSILAILAMRPTGSWGPRGLVEMETCTATVAGVLSISNTQALERRYLSRLLWHAKEVRYPQYQEETTLSLVPSSGFPSRSPVVLT